MTYFNRTAVVLTAVLISHISSAPALAGNSLTIMSKAPYAKGLEVKPAIRVECKLEDKIPTFVKEFAGDSYETVTLADNTKKAKGDTLEMNISSVTGFAGGAWSGRKSLSVSGTLKKNGKIAGTFVASRGSGRGYRGTCSLLGRSAKAIAKDIAGWLKNPTKNARLGEAK